MEKALWTEMSKLAKIIFWTTTCVLLLVFTAQYLITDKTWLVFLDNLHWTISCTAAAAMAWIGLQSTGAEHEARRWFFAGLVAYLIGQLLWDIQVYIGWLPFPSPFDIAYLMLGPCCLLGLAAAMLTLRSKPNNAVIVLDTAILSVSILALTLVIYLPKSTTLDTLSLSVLIAYPVFLLTAASYGILIVLHLRPHPHWSWVLFQIGLGLQGVIWMWWNIQALSGNTHAGSILNGLFTICSMMLGISAMRWRMVPSDNLRYERWCEWILRMSPLIAIIIAATASFWVLTGDGILLVLRETVLLCAIAVIVLAFLRQSRILKEREEFLKEEKDAKESMLLAASVYETSSEAIMITNASNEIIAVNPAFIKITGYVTEEVIGKNSSFLQSGHHDETFYQAIWNEINSTGHWQGEVWDQRKNGENYPKWLTINTVYNENGSIQRRVAMFTDVSRKREAEEMIWRQANLDTLTGLPNRQMFHDRLDQEIKKAHRASCQLALLFIDLDRFKEINDTLGHDKGDTLLKEAAHRIASCVRETDTVARLGGDEFTIIMGGLHDASHIDRVVQNILQKMTEPFQLGEDMAYISASIGITLYPVDATVTEVLLKNADQAMYAAKNQGRNRYSYFTASMQQAVKARVQIANDLRSALAGNQFSLAYQPIIELATGAIYKAEALLRWHHPTKGLISPAVFIPIAEDTGLIVDIGDWVFRTAAQQAKEWRNLLNPAFQISVNKSPVQFHNEKKSHTSWYDYLSQLGLPGHSIAVEITEGLLLDASTLVTERLLEFRDAGIQVSLDDFGTGYSSLSYLKKFDIDYLKIDQAFIRNLALGSDDMALCEAIIVMAHKLGIQVIAEGVETVEQKNLLTAAGCDYGQGYFFERPVSAEEFLKFIETKR